MPPASRPATMCSVSARPVMKMTGTLLKPASRLRRRQVSKPSMPGMTASSRTMSGVIWSTIRIAAAPSIATMTVIPAPSSASVSRRSVSGESSMTSAMSRFLVSVIIAVQRLQGCHVLIEVEAVDQDTHLRDEAGMLRIIGSDLIELHLNRANVTHLSEADQFFDMLHRRPRAAARAPMRDSNLIGFIMPFDPQQLADQFQQPRDIYGFHQIAVVERLRHLRAVCLQRACRNHQDAGLVMAGRTQRLRDGPAVHARHRDVEQEQIGPAMLRERETAGAVRRAQQDEAQRR